MKKKKLLSTAVMMALFSIGTHAGTVGRFHFLAYAKGQHLTYYTQLADQHCVSSATGLPASFSAIDNTLKLAAQDKDDATRPCFYQESYYIVNVYADAALSEKIAKVKFRNRSRLRWLPIILSHKVDVSTDKLDSDNYKVIFGPAKT